MLSVPLSVQPIAIYKGANNKMNKISKSLFTLNKVKNSLSSTALKSLYYALIHPYILYCLPVISCSSQKNINMLALKQKRCIRIICKASYIENRIYIKGKFTWCTLAILQSPKFKSIVERISQVSFLGSNICAILIWEIRKKG